jgi:hypothetical protein
MINIWSKHWWYGALFKRRPLLFPIYVYKWAAFFKTPGFCMRWNRTIQSDLIHCLPPISKSNKTWMRSWLIKHIQSYDSHGIPISDLWKEMSSTTELISSNNLCKSLRFLNMCLIKNGIISRNILKGIYWVNHLKWVPSHHGMERPQVADGGVSLQIWRVAANIANKQTRTAERGGPPAWWLGVGLTTSHRKK